MTHDTYRIENLDIKTKPAKIIVRKFCEIRISFSLNFTLPSTSFINFRFRGGRNNKNDWYYLQTTTPNAVGDVSLQIDSLRKEDAFYSFNSHIVPIVIQGKDLLVKYYLCNQTKILKDTILSFKVSKTLAQSLAEKEKPIEIFVQLPNQKPILLENYPKIEIHPDTFDHMELLCPSTPSSNQNFDCLIRFQDKHKNLVSNFSGQFSLKILKETNHQLEISSQKLIKVEESNEGLLKIPIKLEHPGIYYIEVAYKSNSYLSNPILCKAPNHRTCLYWGYIHGHSSKSDGVRSITQYFQNFLRSQLNFGTTTEHDRSSETSEEDFEEIKALGTHYTENVNNFISFFGYEYGTWYTGIGDFCIYYKNNSLPIFRSAINKYNSSEKLYKHLIPHIGEVLIIAHHTALRPGYRNWDHFNNQLEKLVEIYSTWGNQEYSHIKGNPLPVRYKFFGYGPYARKRGPILEKKGCFVADALLKGYKLGFTAGGDDHFGIYPGGSIDPDNGIYPPGIMAIWAEDLTLNSLWKALNKRRCYGTTGIRVIIEFFLEDYYMGDIINIEENPELYTQRTITFKIISPISIEKVEVVRNNKVLKVISVNKRRIDSTSPDIENFNKICRSHINKKERFVYYYLRIFLAKENMAWSSPIWIINALH